MSSTEQKLNTRSSTETEIVGADDFMPAICWTPYFMKAQGYGVKDNVLFQDNTSSILLEKNGKALSSKRTKHINIRYLFITDRVKKEEVSLVWRPTGDMIGDFATKPRRAIQDQGRPTAMSAKSKQAITSLRKAKQNVLIPPGKKAAPQECVGSRTRDRGKGNPGSWKKISDH
jgi:hypothetical protein